MPALVIRIYENHAAATKVVNELTNHNFSSGDIKVIRPGATKADTIHTIRETGIPHAKSHLYAEALTGDRVLVVVNPPFGEGAFAEEVVDKHNPIEAGISSRLDAANDFSGDSTPLSRYFGWPVLSNNPTPLSSQFGWRTLSEKQGPTGQINLSANPAPFSSAFGLRTLSDSPAPFSLRGGWRLLSSSATPLSDRMGWATLTSKKFAMGDVNLSNNPAPFSSMFGLPVLSTKQ